MADLLPPAVQTFIVNATSYLEGIDMMIAKNIELMDSITAVKDAMVSMGAQTAGAADLSAMGGAAAGATSTAEAEAAASANAALADSARAAAQEETTLSDAERLAAEAAALEKEMAAGLEEQLVLQRDASMAAAAAQTALRDGYMAASSGIVKVSDAQKAEITATKESSAAADKSAASWSGMGKAGNVALLGLAGAIGLSVDKAMNFNTEVTRLYTAAGLTNASFQQVSAQLLKLGNQFGFTGTQMAQAMYHPVSAGLDLQTSLALVGQAANLADIHGAHLEDTTYALSSVMKAFNQNANDAGKTAALLNSIVGQGDMRFQDFNQSVKNWAPTASAMGISIQSMGSAIAYLTDRGNSAEVASTRLTMGLSMMTAGSKQANGFLHQLGLTADEVKIKNKSLGDAMTAAGLTTNRLAEDLRKPDGVYTALKDIQDAFHKAGLSAEESNQLMAKIFGGGRSDKAIMSLMQNLDGLKQKYDDIGKGVANYGKQSAEAAKTPQQQWKDFKATVENLGIAFGQSLMPAVTSAMSIFKAFLQPITEFMSKNQFLMGLLGSIAAGIAAAVLGLKAWAAIQGVINALLAIFDAEAAANPIGLIVIAIAALVVGIIYLWNNSKGFHNFIVGAWNWMKTAALATWHALEATWRACADAIGWLLDFVKGHWRLIITVMLGPLGLWIALITKYWTQVKTIFVVGFQTLAAPVLWWWHNIVEPMTRAVGFLFNLMWNDWIKPAFGFMAAEVHLVAAVLLWWWHNVTEPIFKMFGALIMWWWHSIVEPAFHAVGAVVNWWVHSVVQPAWNLVTTTTHALGSVFTWLNNNAISPAIHAIGSVCNWLYHTIIQPVWNGIKSAISSAWDTIRSIFNAITSAVQHVGDVISSVFSNIRSTIGGATNIISGVSHMLGFAEGGPVPGPKGRAQLAVVHGGEYVLSNDMIDSITGSGVGNPMDALSTMQVATSVADASGAQGSYVHIVNVNMNIQGSVKTERDLVETVRREVLRTNIRNPTNVLSLPTGR